MIKIVVFICTFYFSWTNHSLAREEVNCPKDIDGWKTLVGDFLYGRVNYNSDYIVKRKRFTALDGEKESKFDSFKKKYLAPGVLDFYVLRYCRNQIPAQDPLKELVDSCFGYLFNIINKDINPFSEGVAKFFLEFKKPSLNIEDIEMEIFSLDAFKDYKEQVLEEKKGDEERLLQFKSTDKEYFENNQDILGVDKIPAGLKSQDFLEGLASVEQIDQTIQRLRDQQKGLPKDQQWSVLNFESQHLSGIEGQGNKNRLLVFIPGKPCKSKNCKGLDYCDRYFQIVIPPKSSKQSLGYIKLYEKYKKAPKGSPLQKSIKQELEKHPNFKGNRYLNELYDEMNDKEFEKEIDNARTKFISQYSQVVACNQQGGIKTPTYIYDYWRKKEDDGKIVISTRKKETNKLENCLQCHTNGLFPIFPKNEKGLSKENRRALRRIRSYSDEYSAGSWVGRNNLGKIQIEADRRDYGPPLGPLESKFRKKVLDLCLPPGTKKKVRQTIGSNMVCVKCHDGKERGLINFTGNGSQIISLYVKGEIKGHEMPLGSDMTKEERELLWDCLRMEYDGAQGTYPPTWIKRKDRSAFLEKLSKIPGLKFFNTVEKECLDNCNGGDDKVKKPGEIQ